MRTLLLRWAIIGVAFWVTDALLTGLHITGGFWSFVWVAALFGIVNAILGTILRILTFPITLATLGLFALVVNAALLALVAGLSDSLTIDDFWTALLAGLIITVVSTILNRVLVEPKRS